MTQPQPTDNCVANFVQKAFEIISNEEYKDIVEWLMNGKQFNIKDIQKFEQQILPQYFRHRNIHSFIRQLNMYGFHKSRKQPTKNIFSHPYFQKNKKQLLTQIKRKIKTEQNQIGEKNKNIENCQSKVPLQTKQVVNKEEVIKSYCSFENKSANNLQKEQQSPLKSLLISKSFILDQNHEACLKLREQCSFVVHQPEQEEDNLSIADEINRERERFNNRTQGISIVKTLNFLEEFQF